MQVTEDIEIKQSKDAVWHAITDIENAQRMISGILNINVLHSPSSGLVGLKWEETREMFGKEATETMWITEAETNEYYTTRAESHGSVYTSKMSLTALDEDTRLTMSFEAQPQSFTARMLSVIMAPLVKGSLKKVLIKDLADIKAFVEKAA